MPTLVCTEFMADLRVFLKFFHFIQIQRAEKSWCKGDYLIRVKNACVLGGRESAAKAEKIEKTNHLRHLCLD